jgi:hypothetical protein
LRRYGDAMKQFGSELDSDSEVDKFEAAAEELLRNEALPQVWC